MVKFVFNRLGYGLLVLFGVVTLVFVLFNILPGDPARMMLGQRADEQSIEIINKDLGLDKPLFTQYLNYLNDLSPISIHHIIDNSKYTNYSTLYKGDKTSIILKKPYLRRSYQSKRPVSDILRESFPNTIYLATLSIAFAFVVGVG
ncbi:MAG: ABC transporter permease, partial [Bacteroidales bacterium]|nr:ABC transporter permease [Bacteroidales bacterium]